jgi:hypothetical protein
MKKLLSAKEPFLLHDFASQCVKEDVREKWNPSQVRDIHGLQNHSLTVLFFTQKKKKKNIKCSLVSSFSNIFSC